MMSLRGASSWGDADRSSPKRSAKSQKTHCPPAESEKKVEKAGLLCVVQTQTKRSSLRHIVARSSGCPGDEVDEERPSPGASNGRRWSATFVADLGRCHRCERLLIRQVEKRVDQIRHDGLEEVLHVRLAIDLTVGVGGAAAACSAYQKQAAH